MEENKDIEIQNENRSIKAELFSWLMYICIAMFLAFMIITFVGQRSKVDGRSMNPTFQDGDNLILDKITYRFSAPKRFDIIAFPYPQNREENYIKRIIGLPGEVVRISNGVIYINNKPLKESYGEEKMLYGGLASGEGVKVKKDEYFVLGDNRNNSKDSRFSDVGNIKREDIIGRALIKLFPGFKVIKK